jgi:hypothetical protein
MAYKVSHLIKKFIRFKFLMSILAFTLLGMVSCIQEVPIPVSLIDGNDIVTEAMKGAPLFANAAITSRAVYGGLTDISKTLEDSPVKSVYSTFKDFDIENASATMEQGVDGSNIWVSLYETITQLESLTTSDDGEIDFSLSTSIHIPPTTNLIEGDAVVYTLGGEVTDTSDLQKPSDTTWAANIEGTLVETLIAQNMTEVGQQEYKSMKYFKHDSSTGDLLLDLNYLVEYSDSGEIYAPRVWAEGNTISQSFNTLAAMYVKNDTTEYFWSLGCVGANTGDGEYMIFNFIPETKSLVLDTWGFSPVNNTDPIITANGWYKIPAGAGIGEFEAAKWYDTLAELVASETDPKGYGPDVENLTMFSTSDIGVKLADSLDYFTNENKLDLP